MNETNSPYPAPGPASGGSASADAPAPQPARQSGPQPATQVTPHVLPLVVRLERAAPPARTDALETAARAVLTLLADERTTGAPAGAGTPDGEGAAAGDGPGAWAAAVAQWEDVHGGGIRKVVRRARGGEWRRAQTLPGITVTGRTAEVRVFPPIPLDAWPKDLAKLQVSGTELDDPEPPESPAEGIPVLWLSPELEMSAGKTMAQAGHGAQLAWWQLDADGRAAWRAAGFPLAVRTASDAAAWDALTTAGLPVVRDAGFTEIAPGKTLAVEGVDRIRSLPHLH